ncbi:Amylopullulanase precursor [Planctomycetes bacterium CA13]|uniref:Amylopullulanase n=1 Tax=Novipirellula herctigrandis TaxID=2527986 RepID=A0A5C5YVI3_9BACT|nr:Amylopullulanase precursor [Planctomycetes bacterium CA13]
MNLIKVVSIFSLFGFAVCAKADIVLIGSDLPNESVLDGDFRTIMSGWRQFRQSPHWTSKAVIGDMKLGLAEGRISSGGNLVATYESPTLDHNASYAKVSAGDVLAWRFAAKAEYPCDATVSFGLVFGDTERVLADQVKVPTAATEPKVFEGTYTVSEEDSRLGVPFARFMLRSDHNINVYVDWVDLKVLRSETAGPRELDGVVNDDGISLKWSKGPSDARYTIYRSNHPRKSYEKIAQGVKGYAWDDAAITNGITYYYTVTQMTDEESAASPVVKIRKVDTDPPQAPSDVDAVGEAWVINLKWQINDKDIASYNILRGDAEGNHLTRIASGITRQRYEDMLPIKGIQNTYAVEAVDYSGNVSPVSETASAIVKAVRGASFSDLLLPMPIHKELSSDLWGAEGVLPRDPDNGVEDPDWTYWGGKVIRDPGDMKYHILVTRWPEGARKGHWEWPFSRVAHVVADDPTGPYKVVDDIAYEFHDGLGHNPNIIALHDRRFALYSLIDWKACFLTSTSMNGPWMFEGELTVEHDESDPRAYRYFRNLSGVQCGDGSILMVTKAGAMMRSENGLLGPYKVLTNTVDENATIPEQYRKSNYEDPALWYDGVQYHMLINAFLDYRAIYLRSPDGVNWKYEDGLAYTPTCTVYEDGTRTFWYKVERPNVLQDEHGRATHLSLAAIDVKKADDYGNDNHSAKHLVIPLVVYRRVSMLNTTPVKQNTLQIKVLIHSEDGFNASQDLDLDSLRLGASEAVNYGRGARLVSTDPHRDGLVLTFDGTANGITAKNFVCKLIGKTKRGELVVGYSKLAAPQ